MHLSVLSLFIGLCHGGEPEYNTGMKLMDPSDLKRAGAQDRISVVWNLSPLYIEKYGRKLGKLGLFHVSLGFFNHNTTTNVTIEYKGNTSLPVWDASRIMPTLAPDGKMSWNAGGMLQTKEGVLDTTYWLNRSRIATIDGTLYNKLLEHAGRVQETMKFYYVFNLAKPDSHDFYLDALTCDTAMSHLVHHLAKIGGCGIFHPDARGMHRNDNNLLADSPPKREMDTAKAYHFYKEFGPKFFEFVERASSGNFSGAMASAAATYKELKAAGWDGIAYYPNEQHGFFSFKVNPRLFSFEIWSEPLQICSETVVV